VSAESPEAVELPAEGLSSLALDTQLLSSQEGLRARPAGTGDAPALELIGRGGSAEQAQRRVLDALSVYRDEVQRRAVPALARRREALAAEKASHQVRIEELETQLGALADVPFAELSELAVQASALAPVADSFGRDGFEIMQLFSERELLRTGIDAADTELSSLADPAAVAGALVGQPTFGAPVKRQGAANVVPLVMLSVTILAAAVAVVTDSLAPRAVRAGVALVSGLGVVWLLVAGVQVARVAADAQSVVGGFAQIEAIAERSEVSASELDDARREVDRVRAALARMDRRLNSPVLAPLRPLPIAGRQLRGVRELVATAATVAVAGDRLLDAGQPLLRDGPPDGSRIRAVRTVDDALGSATETLRVAVAPADDGLLPALGDQITDYEARRARLLDRLERTSATVAVTERLLSGSHRYLLIAGNSSEVRSSMGGFLSFAALEVSEGEVTVGDVKAAGEVPTRPLTPGETGILLLPPDAVRIADGDLSRHFGFLQPNRLYGTLGLSPRFGASAATAAAMWEATGYPDVEAAVYLDTIGLASLLDATGPVELDGTTYTADTLLAYLLVGQYDEFGADSESRRAKLERITVDVVEHLDQADDLGALFAALRTAARERHLMLWAEDPTIQAALLRTDLAGEPSSTSVTVSVAAMNGKFAPFVESVSRASAVCAADRQRVELTTTVTYRGISIRPDYIDASASWAVPAGTYIGMAVYSLPAGAADIAVTPAEGSTPVARGKDGATRLEGHWFSIQPGQTATMKVSFSLPSGVVIDWTETGVRGPINRLEPAQTVPPQCLAGGGASKR
jgi:hypothetical protein